ncbi:unnamed protein product [Brassicogethes aeneus]|uniref:Uncharacterized protein n=1 Tax=Brassicogethes aeneus TaxID=1431903 RepID=A0A9P0B164_BRAAE|nr:unnamed protein product [Brassicogethes aeneus]
MGKTRGKDTKLSSEEKKERKRQRERERRRQIRDDPIKREEQREKERRKYLRQKREKIRTSISEMTSREQRQKRKDWKNYTREYRLRKKEKAKQNELLANNTPPTSDDENDIPLVAPGVAPTPSQARGKKLSNRNKMKRHLERKKLKQKLEALQRKVQQYKKRFQRLQKQMNNKTNESMSSLNSNSLLLTPNTRVNLIIEESKSDADVVKKKLLFGEVIKDQLRESYNILNTTREKQVFKKIVSGNVIKKYNLKTKCSKYFKFRKTPSYETSDLMTYKQRDGSRSYLLSSIKKKVQDFYEEDINSRLCPGKKDFVTRNKIRRQKRLLGNTIKNLYIKYIKRNPKPNISYRFFCRNRPFWVKPLKVTDRNTCQCIIHANMNLMVDCLYSNKVISSKAHSHVIKDVCCNDQNENCLLRKCTECKKSKILYNSFEPNRIVQYFKWVNLKQSYFDKKSQTTKFTKKIAKVPFQSKCSQILKQFEQQLYIFMAHKSRIGHQYSSIVKLKETLKNNELLIHCDFSENYNLKYSEEVQSFHFGGSRQQVSMHTTVVYSNLDNSACKAVSFCTLSESLDHNPPAIWAHLCPILKFYSGKGIEKLHFLSDSPSTQYRNKTMFSFITNNLLTYFEGFKDVTWNYSEAGHGKGAPDGIGGVCKRTADRIVAQGRDISSFMELVDILKENCPGVNFFVVSKADIEVFDNLIKESKILPFHGTMKVHQIRTYAGTYKLWLRSISCYNCAKYCSHYELGTLEYKKATSEATNIDLSNKDLLPISKSPREKVRYEDVYSDDTDDEPCCSKPPSLVKTGSYVLVAFTKNKIKKDTNNNYRYVGVCQSDIDNDGEVTVTFLKLIDDQKNLQTFKLDENDKSYILQDQILEVLPEPSLLLKGNRVFYRFQKNVDVFESS